MPTTDTKIKSPIVNVLTKAQYDSISSPSSEEFYLITDDTNIVAGYGIEVTTSSNGETIIGCTAQTGSVKILFQRDDGNYFDKYTGAGSYPVNVLSDMNPYQILEEMDNNGTECYFQEVANPSVRGSYSGALGRFYISYYEDDGNTVLIIAQSLTWPFLNSIDFIRTGMEYRGLSAVLRWNFNKVTYDSDASVEVFDPTVAQ